MQQLFSIIFFILFVQINAFTQNEFRRKVDSLQKVLPILKDSSRIDCLNALCNAFMQQNGNGFSPYNLVLIHRDSANMFAQKALRDATRINYTKGSVIAYINLGRIESTLYNDYGKVDDYFTKALQLSADADDDNYLSQLYALLGWTKWVEAKFPEAVMYFKKAAFLFKKTNDTASLSETLFFMSKAEQESGNYGKALEYALKYQDLSGQEFNALLGALYESIGDNETALYYAKNDPERTKNLVADIGIGNIFYQMNQYDSAMYYYRRSQKMQKIKQRPI